MGRIVVYTTHACLHSARLKRILSYYNIPFREVNIHHYPLCIDELKELSGGLKFLPQLFFNDKPVGGLQKVLELVESDKLKTQCDEAIAAPDTELPQFLPPPKTRTTTMEKRHVKYNVVIEEIYQKIRASTTFPYKKSKKGHIFKGADLVAWLVKNNKSNKETAIKLGGKLLEAKYFVKVKDDKPFGDDNTSWQWSADRDMDILNSKVVLPQPLVSKTGEAIERFPVDITTSLVEDLSLLVDRYVGMDGNIDYSGLKKDKDWKLFLGDILELNLITVFFQLSPKELMVFSLQLHYILHTHLMIWDEGLPSSPVEYLKLCTQRGYYIQGMKFNLSTISTIIRTGRLPKSDKKKLNIFGHSRKSLAVDHRALFHSIVPKYCSPPIIAVTSKNIDFAFQWDTEAFLYSTKVTLPRMVQLFRNDIGKTDKELCTWLVQFLPEAQERKLNELLLTTAETIRIEYKKCSWEDGGMSLVSEIELVEDREDSEVEGDIEESEEMKDEEVTEDTDITSQEVSKKIIDANVSGENILDISLSSLKAIPYALVKEIFPSLKRLNLTNNSIGSLPTSFGVQLNGLTMLYLSKNKLKAIPHCLANIRNLEHLDLSSNNISAIPNKFCTLRTLKQLHLNDNELSSLPIGFPQLRALEELNLSNNVLEELIPNFGEMGLLENLDLHSNRLVALPDMSNLILLEELVLKFNKIKDMDFGLDGLRHLISLDLSHNEVKEIPENISRLVYLQEFNISSNKLKRLPREVCELLSLKTLQLRENNITDPPSRVCNKGINAIRKHFEWEKPLPKQQAVRNRGGVVRMRDNDETNTKSPVMSKSLSTREKRALLMKKRTNKQFDTKQLGQLRDKYGADDINAFLKIDVEAAVAQQRAAVKSKIDEVASSSHSKMSTRKNSVRGTPRSKGKRKHASSGGSSASTEGAERKLSQESSEKGSRHHDIIKNVPGFHIEKPGSVPHSLELQEFAFKPHYHSQYYDKPHINFLAVSKTLGPVVVSILEIEKAEDKEGPPASSSSKRRNERSKSLVNFGTRRLRSKQKEKEKEKEPETEKGSGSAASDKKTRTGSVDDSSSPPIKNRSIRGSLLVGSAGEKVVGRMRSLSTSVPRKPPADISMTKAFVRTRACDYTLEVKIDRSKGSTKTGGKHLLKALKEQHPQFSGIQFKLINDQRVNDELLKVELRLMVRGYKFGILYQRSHQKTENEFFNNTSHGPQYQEFLEWMGDEIELFGWNGYNAGLDTVQGTTGKTSRFTRFRGFEMMFHVSTMLPYTDEDEQQLSRKRHLGNDIVIILFREEDDEAEKKTDSMNDIYPPFDPSDIRSFFNHTFFIVSKDREASAKRGVTCYKVATTAKDGVEVYKPGLPKDSIIEKTEDGRETFLVKLINSESAAYSAPGFSKAIERTREALMKSVFDIYAPSGTASTGWG